MNKKFFFKFSGRYGNNIIQIINAFHVHMNHLNSILLIPNNRSNLIKSKIIDQHNSYIQNFKDNLDFIFLSPTTTSNIKYENIFLSNWSFSPETQNIMLNHSIKDIVGSNYK